MKIIESILSPDGRLNLQVQEGDDGAIVIGFINGSWHSHTDSIASWLGVSEEEAIQTLLTLLTSDRLPIIISTDGGATIDPWLSDNHEASITCYGAENCIVRLWSTNNIN